MKVESSGAAPRAHGRRSRRALRIAWGAALVTALALVGVVLLGSETLRTELMQRSGAETPEQALRAALRAPANFADAMLSAEAPPRLKLDIKFKHLHKIHEKRDAALAAGVLRDSPSDFVPATIEVDGRTAVVKLRLVGGDISHLRGQKWSLRIHVEDDGHVFGLRRFSLLAPWLRGYQAETLFLEHLRREDVLAPRYFFVDTVFNGKQLGLMALEESFSTELLEHQRRRDGVILHLIAPPDFGEASDIHRSAGAVEIVPFRAGHITKSKKLSSNLETATRLLRGFLNGTLDPGVVFDVEAMGRFLAVAETWGASHALRFENLRFYFNPLTARLEPIGFAGEIDVRGRDEKAPRSMPFARMLLENPRVQVAYVAALRRSEAALAMQSEPIARAEARWLRLLHREYPMRVAYHPATAAARAARVSEVARSTDGAVLDRASDLEALAHAIIPERSVEQNLARHAFLRWDEQAREFSVLPGRWAVDGSIFLPKGAALRIPAGVVLTFERDKGLIARGPLLFEGRADAPVVLEGPASDKRSKLWSGVYLVESDRPSRWSHVRVRNTGGFKRRGWELPGGVVFRKTRVDFTDCRFTDNHSDDSLNLVRSTFTMTGTSIDGAKSDALDLDYSQGEIAGGQISNARGDGIDLGGSTLELRGMKLTSLHDKAIVVGERSQLNASAIEIERADIGLASKNESYAELRQSQLRDIRRVALLVYANRSEFGASRLISTGNRISGVGRVALAEQGSDIVIDGESVASEKISIASLEELAGSDR